MAKRTVFISHRHRDRDLAQIVADFVDRHSGGRARIFCTSSKDFEGIVPGERIEPKVREVLAVTDLVLLVYTNESEDWSWCMYECGLATDLTNNKPTKIVVLQCGPSPPKPYGDHLCVDLHNLESIAPFVRTLLTSAEYFPAFAEPLTDFAAEGAQVADFAEELHRELGAVLERFDVADAVERPASAYLCLEFDREALDALRSADDDGVVDVVKERARVAGDSFAHALFGFVFPPNTALGAVIDEWADGDAAAAGPPPRWVSSLAKQMRAVAGGKIQEKVDWASCRTRPGEAVIPYVAGSRTIPSTGGLQFHVYFVPMSPRPIPVVERMVPRDVLFHRNLAETPGDTIRLLDLRTEMETNGRSRVPMLGEDARPRFIVHRSMIDAFLVKYLASAQPEARARAYELTVHDLLVDPASETVRTFAVVGPDADMDEALAAMRDVPGCQDVFVTADGSDQGGVLGWLTNTMFL